MTLEVNLRTTYETLQWISLELNRDSKTIGELENHFEVPAGSIRQICHMITSWDKRAKRSLRNQLRAKKRKATQEVQDSTGIRKRRQKYWALRKDLLLLETTTQDGNDAQPMKLQSSLRCYVCKNRFTELHSFYDQLCPSCAKFNWKKRNRQCDLSGKIALVTGGRIKIGFEVGVKLLRAGATVIITSRFIRDAQERYKTQPDWSTWQSRLHFFEVDLRYILVVEQFGRFIVKEFPRIDILINNAAQTIQRPDAFYRHLKGAESLGYHSSSSFFQSSSSSSCSSLCSLPPNESKQLEESKDLTHGFPQGRLDADGQQIDLRTKNSWTALLPEITTLEMIETYSINALAPSILLRELLPSLTLETSQAEQTKMHAVVVNVTACEGIFYRAKKPTHVHTNMAKSALNMLTRTYGEKLKTQGVYCVAVDTGWINDMYPVKVQNEENINTFHPPLDEVDGAARILDPVWEVFSQEENHQPKLYPATLLKDYQVGPW